jgi:hypothetical protein
LWSINDSIFSLRALVVVAILVGISTYLIVFNLNNIASSCSRVYHKRKRKLIEQMRTDPAWSELGKRFDTFQIKHERAKPSEWTLVLFQIRKLIPIISVRWKSRKQQKTAKSSNPTVELDEFQWPLPFLTELDAVNKDGGSTTDKEPGPQVVAQPLHDGLMGLSKVFRRGALSPGLQSTYPGASFSV